MTTHELIEHLKNFVTDERFLQLQKVLNNRTRYMTVVLEDIFQTQNASAVLRTCECFGIQDVHIIENRNQFKINPDVVKGASKWLTIQKYHSKTGSCTAEAIKKLKENGYRIVATSPHTNDIELPNFDVTKGKFAIVIGSEKPGISNDVKQLADEFIKVPMVGFTESLNLSVCTALVVSHLRQSMEQNGVKTPLCEIEKDSLMLEWLKKSIKSSNEIIDRIMLTTKSNQ